MATRAYFRFEKHLMIPDYFCDGLKISDLQLAVAISRTDQESELVKNNLKIIPNVPHIFGTDSRTLYVYSELYNLDFSDQLCNSRFNAIFTIVDKNGHAIKSYNIAHEKPASSCALSYAISLEDLQAGPYRLTLQVEDSTNSRMAFQSTNFTVIKPYGQYTEEEFSRLLRQLSFVVALEDIQMVKSLSGAQRHESLNQLLKKLDPVAESEQNEFLQEYFRRILYANQNFCNVRGEGWETEQGEIYLKYGDPDNIQEFHATSDNKTYEVWEYCHLNRKYVFVDESGVGEFRLVKKFENAEPGISLY